ncbi:Serine/Threonine-Protein Kinase N3 [Manis pentadactyla]|nr:Serine/Threonine-Protein Kinase N3 [Manis pentadactyla]
MSAGMLQGRLLRIPSGYEIQELEVEHTGKNSVVSLMELLSGRLVSDCDPPCPSPSLISALQDCETFITKKNCADKVDIPITQAKYTTTQETQGDKKVFTSPLRNPPSIAVSSLTQHLAAAVTSDVTDALCHNLIPIVIFHSGKANFSDMLETKLCVHPGSKERSSVNDGIFLQVFGTGYLI